jgi:hypothetical protein
MHRTMLAAGNEFCKLLDFFVPICDLSSGVRAKFGITTVDNLKSDVTQRYIKPTHFYPLAVRAVA